METMMIEKEMLAMLPLKSADCPTAIDREVLRDKLNEAALLGNTYKSKCTLTIQTADGARKVNTTVWYASDNHVCLKGGITIPVKCIVNLEI